MSEQVSTPPEASRVARRGHVARRRVPGRAFAIGFGLFLVVATVVFTYLAREAQRSREAAFDQMQHDGVIVPSSE